MTWGVASLVFLVLFLEFMIDWSWACKDCHKRFHGRLSQFLNPFCPFCHYGKDKF